MTHLKTITLMTVIFSVIILILTAANQYGEYILKAIAVIIITYLMVIVYKLLYSIVSQWG